MTNDPPKPADLQKFVYGLMTDEAISARTKVDMLRDWKHRLIAHNAGTILDKAEAEQHFEWLKLLDESIAVVEASL